MKIGSLQLNLSINLKLAVLYWIIVIFSLVGVGMTIQILKSQEATNTVVDLSGAQRMLSQRMTKNALIIAGGEGDVAGAATQVQTDMERFERVLRGLEQGDAPLGLVAVTDAAMLEQLQVVQTHWSAFQSELEQIVAAGPGAAATARLLAIEPLLLTEANNFVQLAVREAGGKAAALRLTQGAIAASSILLVVIAGLLVLRGIIKPLREVTAALSRLAAGDLTHEPLPERARDEIGLLVATYNHLLTAMRSVLGQIRSSADAVNLASHELSAAAEQSGTATEQIAAAVREVAVGAGQQSGTSSEARESMTELQEAIRQIAAGATEQARAVEDASTLTGSVAQSLVKVSRDAEDVAKMSLQALTAARNGGKAVAETEQGMAGIRASAQESADRVRQLGTQSQEIGQIVQVISEIADQTNLLALNAAIEAARAGEHGKGFAVVADEVRRLAERSSQATGDIAKLIETIQRGVEEAVGAMEEGSAEVDRGAQLTDRAAQSLTEILTAMEQTNVSVQAITAAVREVAGHTDQVVQVMEQVAAITEENTAATEEMSAASEQVMRSVENASAIAEQTAASSEEVSASTEEVNEAVRQIRDAARELSRMSGGLQQVVAQYRLAGAGPDRARDTPEPVATAEPVPALGD